MSALRCVRRLARRLIGAAALLAVAAAVPARTQAAPEPYRIDVILSMTGSAAFLGKGASVSLGVLQNLVNGSGGIDGRPVRFAIADDQSSPQVAVQLANAIVASKAPVMLGASITATCSAIAPLVKNGPVDFCLSPGIHPADGSYVFAAGPSTLDLAIVTARYLHARGLKRVAFIFTTDGSGQDGESVVNAAFHAPENRDLEMVDVEHFGVGDLSVAAQLARIKAASPDALFVWASGTPTATVLRALQNADLNIPVLTSYSNATYDQMNAYKGFLPKELLFPGIPTMAPDQLPKGKLHDAVSIYEQALRRAGVRPDVAETTSWDAALLLVSALRRLGPQATAPQIRAYLASLQGWVGVTGSYDFRAIPQRGVSWRSSVLMTRWDTLRDTWVGVGPLGG